MNSKYINYYDLLEISPNSTLLEIEKAFKHAAKIYHPDKQGNNESANRLFQFINDARNVLTDPFQKKVYDEQLGLSFKHSNTIKPTWQKSNDSSNQNGGALFLVGLLGLWLGSEISNTRKPIRKKLR